MRTNSATSMEPTTAACRLTSPTMIITMDNPNLGRSRADRSRTSTTDLGVPRILPLTIGLSGAERWLHASTARCRISDRGDR